MATRKPAPKIPDELKSLVDACNAIPLEILVDKSPGIFHVPQVAFEYIISPMSDRQAAIIYYRQNPKSLTLETYELAIDKVVLYAVIEGHANWSEYQFKDAMPDTSFVSLRALEKALGLKPTHELVRLGFNSDSSLKITSTRVLTILEKHRVPIERLGACEVCGNIYWQRRIGTRYCGEPTCQQNFNKRKQRLAKSRAELSELVSKLQSKENALLKYSGLSSDHNLRTRIVDEISEIKLKIDLLAKRVRAHEQQKRSWLDIFQEPTESID